MHDWLYESSPPAFRVGRPPAAGAVARLRGVRVSYTPDLILSIAREGIAEGERGALSCQSWFVPVGNYRVAPKWLVSRLTGLPVSTFHSGDARRVLNELGIEVMRV